MGHIFLQLPSTRKKSREQIYKTTLSSYIYNVVSACAASFRYEWLTGSLFLRRFMFTYYIYMPMIYRYLIDTWNWLQTFVVCSLYLLNPHLLACYCCRMRQLAGRPASNMYCTRLQAKTALHSTFKCVFDRPLYNGPFAKSPGKHQQIGGLLKKT